MVLDRYVKVVLTIIAVTLVVIAVRPLVPQTTVLSLVGPEHALAQTVAPKYEVTIPKAWGKFIGYSNNNLLLEAPDGWRVVDIEGRAPEYPKIKAFIRWQ